MYASFCCFYPSFLTTVLQPDLVLKSKQNASKFAAKEIEEATVCRLCNDIAEDAIQARCRHIFDRECIKQYINTAVEQVVSCFFPSLSDEQLTSFQARLPRLSSPSDH